MSIKQHLNDISLLNNDIKMSYNDTYMSNNDTVQTSLWYNRKPITIRMITNCIQIKF